MSLNKILREVTLYITSVFVIRIYFVSLPFFSLPSCTCVLIFSHTALTVGIIIASRGSATKCSKTTYTNLRLHPYKKRFLLSNYITSRNAKNNARQNMCRRLLIMNNYKYTDNANDIYCNYEYIFFLV